MSIDALLDFIAKPESNGDLNAVWGGIKKADRPKVPLTEMTVGEVLDWQDSIDAKYMSEAAGGWQFMEDTLRGLYRQAGVPLTAKFNEATQRKLATQLLKRRGLDDYLAGKIDAVKFGQNLSKEWASLPCTIKDRNGKPAQGQSYYSGDGLNKAHVTIDALMDAIDAVNAKAAPEPRTSPVQSKTVQATVATAAAGATTVGTAVGALDGTAQLVLIVAGCVMALGLLFIFKDRLRKWADGVR